MLWFDCDKEIPRWKLSFLMDIFASGDGAILSWEMKEKRGWALDIDTDIQSHRDFSTIKIEYSIEPEHLLDSLKLIFDVMSNAAEVISEEQIESVRPFYTNHLYPRMALEHIFSQ